MPSGVYRLRNSRKRQSTDRMANPKPGGKEFGEGFARQSDYKEVKADVNVGSGLAPKKSRGIYDPQEHDMWTMPPISDEQPSRGEHHAARSSRSTKH